MDWLNYHHLRYFWAVAKTGSLKEAAARLHVSQPSVSAQIAELEAALGEKLFARRGRAKVLTDAGQIAFRFADEIFALGRELVGAVQQRPGAQSLRLYVGVADSFPKLVTHEILAPVFSMPQTVHVICREGKVEELLEQLAVHRLDIVLADEPASHDTGLRLFNQTLGESATSFCAARSLAMELQPGFPRSLDGAPALFPAENTALRRTVEAWFREQAIRPRVVAECEDLSLMQVMAAEGRGFIALPTVITREVARHYGFELLGTIEACRVHFHAITAERRILHPAVTLMTRNARAALPQTPSAVTGKIRRRSPVT